MRVTAADLLELSVAERIQLLGDIWDSVAEVPEAVEVTGEVLDVVRERLAAYRRDPTAGSPWAEVRERILGDR
jgi:putative addiction module component (TIGR02574 family)